MKEQRSYLIEFTGIIIWLFMIWFDQQQILQETREINSMIKNIQHTTKGQTNDPIRDNR